MGEERCRGAERIATAKSEYRLGILCIFVLSIVLNLACNKQFSTRLEKRCYDVQR